MTEPGDRDRRMTEPEDRLARLSEASLHINESLEFEAVLQGVLDSARSLTDARFGVIALMDPTGLSKGFLSSGMTTEESRQLWETPDGMRFFHYLNGIAEPLRVRDLPGHIREAGLPELRVPIQVSAFLMTPIRCRGNRVGNIYMAKSGPGEEFSQDDEETLTLFTSQAGLVIDNARRHRDERRARANLETLINTSPVGVVVFDARTGALVSVNRETGRTIDNLRDEEQSEEQLLQMLTVRRADGRELSLAELSIAEVLSAGAPVLAEEVVLKVPDGRSVKTLINATPVLSEEGEVESFVVTMQDMMPLEELGRLRAEVLGMVSHELRAPLTSIRGSATTILDAMAELDPVELRQFLRIIVEQADNMRDLIGHLLDVAHIETGTLAVMPEPVETALLVDRAKSTFLSGLGRNNLNIDLALDLPLVMADRRRIVQVISNLLSNAARHSPESSAITVTAVRQGADVAVSVIDQGMGMSPEQLTRLFRKAPSPDAGGRPGDIGVGLAVCKGIVEAHGGRIWAKSEGPGLGSQFTFTIPAVGEAATKSYSPSAPCQQQMKGAPILVVDDDPETLRHVRKTLTEAGYQPIVSADPEEAIRLVKEHQPHLVLLDMILPGFDGIDLMGYISDITEVPVVFLSAFKSSEMIARALEMGASDYVVKPFSPTELTARVRAVLRRHRAEHRQPFVLGALTIDYAERRVTVNGRPVQLTPIEYGLVYTLSINAGRTVTHEELLRQAYSRDNKPRDVRSIRTHLKRVRHKLGEDADNPTYIFAERRVGYRMPKGETRELAGRP